MAPSITSLTAAPGPATEDGVVTLEGSFTDPGVNDSHVLKVNWGDGSAAQTFNLAAGDRSFSKTHKYLDNPNGGSTFTITTEVDDNDTGVGTRTNTTTVNNAPPSNFALAATSETTINEGSYVGYTLTFADPGTLDTHKVTVDWDDPTDDTTLDLDAGVLTTTHLQHKFADNGTFDVKATVVDKDGGSTTQTLPIHVTNVNPTVSFDYDQANADEGKDVTFVFNVADPGVLDSQDVSVDWGDGKPSAILHLPAEQRSFQLTHKYVDDNPTSTAKDLYPVKVTATDKDLGVGTADLQAVVKNVAPTLALSLDKTRVDENNVVKLSGTITDPGVEDTNTVVIDWGPGRTQADRITTLAAARRSADLRADEGVRRRRELPDQRDGHRRRHGRRDGPEDPRRRQRQSDGRDRLRRCVLSAGSAHLHRAAGRPAHLRGAHHRRRERRPRRDLDVARRFDHADAVSVAVDGSRS